MMSVNMKAAPALWRFYCMRENKFTYSRFLFVFEAIESKWKKLRQKNESFFTCVYQPQPRRADEWQHIHDWISKNVYLK